MALVSSSPHGKPGDSGTPRLVLKHTYLAFATGFIMSAGALTAIVMLYRLPEHSAPNGVWIAVGLAMIHPFLTGAGGLAMDRALARERAKAAEVARMNAEHAHMLEEYRTYLDITPGTILRSRLNPAGQLVVDWVNQSGLDLFKITMEEARGRNIFDFIIPEDRAIVEANVRTILAEGIGHGMEIHVWDTTGRTLTVLATSVPIKEAGQKIGLHTIVSDLTELRAKDAALLEERARLERMQRLSHTGSWEYDLTTNQIIGSVHAFHIYGLPLATDYRLPLDKVRALNLDPQQAHVALLELIQHNRPYDIVFEINRHGERRIIHSVAEVLRRDNGAPYKVVGSIQDITDRVRLERQLAAAQKDRILNRLAAGIAHDFNNVLAAILGNLELLASEASTNAASETSRELLREIKRATLRGKEMTRGLLAFARSEPAQNQRALNLADIINEVCALLHRSLHRNITIQREIAPNLGTIDGIASEIHQVLMNLCVNASEAMPSGGQITLRLRAIVLDASLALQHPNLRVGEYLELTVADTGHGMPPEILERIFEPFFTTKSEDLPDKKKGTGLGLATVKNIIERHRGSIAVESAPGLGTQFTVFLPKGSLKPEAEIRPAPAAVSGSGRFVLIVEDEEPIRMMLSRLLGSLGYKVLVAVDGLEGVEMFRQHPEVECVIIDLSMPNLNGEEAFRRMRAIRPCKVIMSSGNLAPELRDHLLSVGLHGVLEKPYDKDTLVHLLRSLE